MCAIVAQTSRHGGPVLFLGFVLLLFFGELARHFDSVGSPLAAPSVSSTCPSLARHMEQGLVGLALSGAEVLSVIQTEWIEHSGNFERVYRAHNLETDKPTYLLSEFQTEREDEDLPLRLLSHFARVNLYALEDVEQDNEDVEDELEDEDRNERGEHKGTIMNRTYSSVYPAVLCPFPNAVPAPVRETFDGQVILSFNFETIDLWEKDEQSACGGTLLLL